MRNNIFLRWVIGIAILSVVFWLGFRLGEIKAIFAGNAGYYGFGSSMMRGYGNFPMRNMMYNMMGPGLYSRGYDDYYGGYGPGMMDGCWNYPLQAPSATVR